MNDEKLTTIEHVKQFLKRSEALRFEGVPIEERLRDPLQGIADKVLQVVGVAIPPPVRPG